MNITILDAVESRMDKGLIKYVESKLSYNTEYWREGAHAKQKEVYKKYVIDRRYGKFHTGLLPLIKKILKKKNIEYKIIDPHNYFSKKVKVNKFKLLPGIDKNDPRTIAQKPIIKKTLKRQKGLIIHPTGTGKTITALTVINLIPGNSLFLVPTVDLLYQTKEEAKKFGFTDIKINGDGKKEGIGKLTIAIINTFKKIPIEEYIDIIDAVFVDECHEITRYQGVLNNLRATKFRIGLTATPPESKAKLFLLKGLIGPKIGEITFEQGKELKIMSEVKLKLIDVPYNSKYADLSYKQMYETCIVANNFRNKSAVKIAFDNAVFGKTSLMIVKEIQHGHNLIKMASAIGFKNGIKFMYSKTKGDVRAEVKKALNDKKINCVITTDIWKRGINIPTLDCFINVAGGFSQEATLQKAGRGLRLAEGKEELLLVDFLDPYKFLAVHTVKRLSTYVKAGFI